MSDDWDAVARAVYERMGQLKLSQRALAERSRVSTSTVVDLLGRKPRRFRSQTLESVSKGLGLPEGYLAAVAAGETPPDPDDPANDTCDARVEHRLSALTDEVAGLRTEIKNLNRNLFARHQ